ncbi:MAG: class I SAM-dependent methyltransferase, partial [Solirubrobacterales bacterium]
LGRVLNRTLTRAPWAWRFLRRPVTRFFDSVAAGWDQRFASDPQRLAALTAALDLLPGAPARALDVGTGTGAGALLLAERYPDVQVTAIDVAPAMIDIARSKTGDPRVRFLVADVVTLDRGQSYDLVVLLNMPPFFEQVAGLLRPGGHVIAVASRGPATPFYTPAATLARGFARHGLETVAAGAGGPGTYYLARRP